MNVLVVDDDAMIRRLLRSLMQRDGYEVEEAEDGAVALERLRSRHYDVVLLDLMMPRVSGWDVLATLRDENPARLSCIIVLSAALGKRNVDPEDAGLVFAVIAKPFDLHDLQKKVHACVESRRSSSEPPEMEESRS